MEDVVNRMTFLKGQVIPQFWLGKKVFLTGHTGFKGSWFSILLNLVGAKVIGYSLKPDKKLNFFDLAKLDKEIYASIIGDIRDYSKLKKFVAKFSPDFIVHMAAQPLVKDSYVNPKYIPLGLSVINNSLGNFNL